LEKNAIESLQDCTQYAHNQGVKLLLEPLFKGDNSLINRCEQAIDLFVKALNLDKATFLKGSLDYGLLLDLFHMHHEEENFHQTLETYKYITGHVHVADHPRSLDFSRFDSTFVKHGIQQLQQQQYTGFVSFESFDANVNLDSLGSAVKGIRDFLKR
jgi:sugar phosphate isomerase/epimerase